MLNALALWVHFDTCNNQQLIRTDETVYLICIRWYRNVWCHYFDLFSNEGEDCGISLTCEGGYLHWPQLVCQFKTEAVTLQKGYFSFWIESVHKDVKCVFGILKEKWKILD